MSETICGYNMVEVQVQKQYLFFSYFPRFKKNHLLLDVDQCEYDLYYCEANSYRSNTVGSYTCISDRKQ